MSVLFLFIVFIAAHLAPVDVSEVTFSVQDESITLVKQSPETWEIKEFDGGHIDQDMILSIQETSIIGLYKGSSEPVDMTRFLEVSTNTNWKSVSEIKMQGPLEGKSITIQRTQSGATLSIPIGEDSTESIKISWEEKITPNDSNE
jgi:hypothetical protein